jgi:hypothetical protein
MVKYHKYFFAEKQYEFGLHVYSNLHYEKKLDDDFRNKSPDLSPASLLICFFKFFSEYEKYGNLVIQISSPTGTPFVTKKDYIAKLEK